MSDYYELVLDGDTEVLKGFVAGYLAASGLHDRVFVCSESNVEHDSLAHQLAEWIGLVADRTHLIVPDQAHEQIREGTERLGELLRLRFVSARKLSGAQFAFSWRSLNRERADSLRGIFSAPPKGIHLEGYEVREEVHEDEKGETGGYAPARPYEASGSGTAAGDPGSVIRWAAELRCDSSVDVETVRLEFSD